MSSQKQSCIFLFSQTAASSALPVPVEAPASGVVVESGPVDYEDAAADEDEDEEDETCVSAMDLMGGNGEFPHRHGFKF